MSKNNDSIPLYVIGLSKDQKSVNEFIASKFKQVLQKERKIRTDIIEAKISVKSQNEKGSRMHYDVTSTIITSKGNVIHTESRWDILKICNKLCQRLEQKLSSGYEQQSNKRHLKSIRKRNEENGTS